MSKNKNKPKKNAAAVAPVEQEAGTTEVIAGPGLVAPADAAPVAPVAPVTTTEVPADAAPAVPADAATETPADKTADTTDVSTKPTTSEVYKDFTEAPAAVSTATSATERAAVAESAAAVPAAETKPAETTPAPKGGFLNYLRSFFYDIGGAIHR